MRRMADRLMAINERKQPAVDVVGVDVMHGTPPPVILTGSDDGPADRSLLVGPRRQLEDLESLDPVSVADGAVLSVTDESPSDTDDATRWSCSCGIAIDQRTGGVFTPGTGGR